jgi:hypothetical protein
MSLRELGRRATVCWDVAKMWQRLTGGSGLRSAAVLLVLVGGCGGKAVAYKDGSADGSGSGSSASSGNGSGNGSGASNGSGSNGIGNVNGSSSGSGNGASSASASSGSGGGQTATVVTTTVGSNGITTTSGGTTTGGTPMVGYPIQPTNGWVSADSNPFKIQGTFYTYGDWEDGGEFLIYPKGFENSGNSICVEGTAEQVLNQNYDVYWGGAVGFNLNQASPDATAYGYNAADYGITGFAFDIGPLPIGGELRFNVVVDGMAENYCAPITHARRVEMRWEDLLLSCWAAEPVNPDETVVQSLHWQIVTNDAGAYGFSFCIENLMVLTD